LWRQGWRRRQAGQSHQAFLNFDWGGFFDLAGRDVNRSERRLAAFFLRILNGKPIYAQNEHFSPAANQLLVAKG